MPRSFYSPDVIAMAAQVVEREQSEVRAATALGIDIKTLRRWLGKAPVPKAEEGECDGRVCPVCKTPLRRRGGEAYSSFRSRVTCGHPCAAVLRNAKNQEIYAARLARRAEEERGGVPLGSEVWPAEARFDGAHEVRVRPDPRPLSAVGARPRANLEQGEATS